MFPNTYDNPQQIKSEPFIINAAQMAAIKENVFDYFGCNEDKEPVRRRLFKELQQGIGRFFPHAVRTINETDLIRGKDGGKDCLFFYFLDLFN